MITCGLLKWQLSMTYSIVNSLNLTFEAEITILKDKIQRPNHDTHGLNKKFDFSNIQLFSFLVVERNQCLIIRYIFKKCIQLPIRPKSIFPRTEKQPRTDLPTAIFQTEIFNFTAECHTYVNSVPHSIFYVAFSENSYNNFCIHPSEYIKHVYSLLFPTTYS